MIEDLIAVIKEYEGCLELETAYIETLGVEDDIIEIDECVRRMAFYQDEIDQCCRSIDVLALLN